MEKTKEELEAEIAQLKKENNVLKKTPGLSLKVSPKGGLSVYGLGRFPVTLYKDQWKRLLEFSPQIDAFLEEHHDQFKS